MRRARFAKGDRGLNMVNVIACMNRFDQIIGAGCCFFPPLTYLLKWCWRQPICTCCVLFMFPQGKCCFIFGLRESKYCDPGLSWSSRHKRWDETLIRRKSGIFRSQCNDGWKPSSFRYSFAEQTYTLFGFSFCLQLAVLTVSTNENEVAGNVHVKLSVQLFLNGHKLSQASFPSSPTCLELSQVFMYTQRCLHILHLSWRPDPKAVFCT